MEIATDFSLSLSLSFFSYPSFPGFFLDAHTGLPLSVPQQTLSDIAVCLARGSINIAQAWINVLGILVKFNPNEKVPCSALFHCMFQLLGM
jgi:hypothetical protein